MGLMVKSYFVKLFLSKIFLAAFLLSALAFWGINQKEYIYESEVDEEILAYGWPYKYATSCQCKKCFYLFKDEYKISQQAINYNIAWAITISFLLSLIDSLLKQKSIGELNE